MLGRSAEPAGLDYWSTQLATLDDLALAALLASSDKFFFNSIA